MEWHVLLKITFFPDFFLLIYFLPEITPQISLGCYFLFFFIIWNLVKRNKKNSGKKTGDCFFLILKPSKEKILFFLFCHQRKKIQKNIFFFQETNWKFSFRRKIFYCQEILFFFCSVKLSRNLSSKKTSEKILYTSMEVLKLPVNWNNLLERIEANTQKPEFVCLECVLKRISVFSDFCTRCQNTQYTG